MGNAKKKSNPFEGLKWYELVIAMLPIALVTLGGAIGGLVGALGMMYNLKVMKGKASAAKRYGTCLGIFVLCVVAYLILASIFLSLIS